MFQSLQKSSLWRWQECDNIFHVLILKGNRVRIVVVTVSEIDVN